MGTGAETVDRVHCTVPLHDSVTPSDEEATTVLLLQRATCTGIFLADFLTPSFIFILGRFDPLAQLAGAF